MRRTLAAVLSLAAMLVATAVTSATAAPKGPITLLSATSLGRGAGVRLDFEIACASGLFYVDFSYAVSQQTGRGGTKVDTRGDPGCTGAPHHVSFVAIPDSGEPAFVRRKVVVSAFLTSCGAPTVCEGFPFETTVRLRKRPVLPQPAYPDRVEVSTAALTATGGVKVDLVVDCRYGGLASGVEVRVAQRLGRTVFQAGVSADPECRNAAHHISVTVPRPPDQPPFRKGPALVAVELNNFLQVGQHDWSRTQANVRIGKAPRVRS